MLFYNIEKKKIMNVKIECNFAIKANRNSVQQNNSCNSDNKWFQIDIDKWRAIAALLHKFNTKTK